MADRILKFEELNQEQMNSINRCMIDLFEYYNTCASAEDWKNYRVFQELITSQQT